MIPYLFINSNKITNDKLMILAKSLNDAYHKLFTIEVNNQNLDYSIDYIKTCLNESGWYFKDNIKMLANEVFSININIV